MLNYKQIFIDVLGEPKCREKLDLYIDFVLNMNQDINNNEYAELHHLLPRSKFKEYEHDVDNIFKLIYLDHVKAHKLLAEAYPISSFARPLNFMMSNIDKNDSTYKNILSEARKEQWKRFKDSPNYQVWRDKRSIFMKSAHAQGKYNMLGELCKERFKDEDYRNNFAKTVSDRWKDQEYHDRVVASMIAERNTPEAKQRHVVAARKNWDNRSEQDRVEFREKMLDINTDEDKRLDASVKLKNLWQNNVEYQSKMKNRKPRGSDGSKMKALWDDPEWRAKTLEKRRLSRLLKKGLL